MVLVQSPEDLYDKEERHKPEQTGYDLNQSSTVPLIPITVKARGTYGVAEEHLWAVACWDDLFDDYTVPGVSFCFTSFVNTSY